jgi:PfaB family protein
VDGHAAQGDVRLFFFHYDCRVNGELRVSVRGGQAGFFTDEELASSAGVLFRAEDVTPTAAPRLGPPVVVSGKRRFSAAELDAFVAGRARLCFGPGFERADTHTRTPTLQGGRMRLLDEVTDFDPGGGAWKRGYLRARLSLSPDQWFFAGHFKDDPCMPGTLMFEGGLQAMAIYLTALGFTLDRDGYRFEPVPEHAYRLRCRGQATPASRELVYELFIDEIVAGPTPTLFADLLGTVDGRKAFHCRRMGLRLVPAYPLDAGRLSPALAADDRPVARVGDFAFDHRSLLACAWGRPSEAFGPRYAPFDAGQRIPRLPGPPYHFMSRVAAVSGPLGGLEKGSAVVVDYDVPADAWYFADNGAPFMPLAVLLEVALQPCGWLASYVGCAVSLGGEVVFRNLDGTATLERPVGRDAGTLTTSARLTSLSAAGGILIVAFAIQVSSAAGLVLSGETVFGFFPPEAMRDQAGLPDRDGGEEPAPPGPPPPLGADALARGRLRMLEQVVGAWPEGGPAGLGRLVATRSVDAADWYFRAHFMGDPVQPGSLGLEAMVQALEALALARGLGDGLAAPRFEAPAPGAPLTWKYRGQVVPENRGISVEVEITEVRPTPEGLVVLGEGSLRVDGKRIYHARGLSARLTGNAAPVQAPALPAGGPGPALLFPLLGDSREALLAERRILAREAASTPFGELSRRRLSRCPPEPELCCVLVARDAAELAQELARAEGGIATARDAGWRTPAGSTFAPRPLGRVGKIAFVYPGMGSAYLGAGAGLFRRYPALLAELLAIPGLAVGASLAKDLREAADGAPSAEQAEAFARDATRVSAASMAMSFALTRLARRDLGVEPALSLGFSIGEGSMFAALGAFPDPAALEARLSRSAVFRERLAGPMRAARERYGVADGEPFTWGAAIVPVAVEAARRALAPEPRVHLLAIHTPAEVMLGGEHAALQRVVAALGAPATFVPFQLAIHCEAALSEQAALTALHTLPVVETPGLTFYAAASGAPVPQTSEAIADHLARGYTRTVDFPALVRRVHDDGARVFVEVGAQASCSRWIARILHDRPHAVAPLSTRTFDDETSLARAVAVLLGQRVPLRLDPLLGAPPAAALVAAPASTPAAPPPPATRAWMEVLAGEIAAQLGWSDPADVPADAPLPLDSLAATELRARLERRFGRRLGADAFGRRPTLRSLAGGLAALGLPEEAASPAPPADVAGGAHLGSWGQSDMWNMPRPISSRLPPAELHRTTPILWLRSRVVVLGALQASALARALVDTFARHDILRSVARDAPEPGPPLVEVLPGWLPAVDVVDLAGLPAAAQEARQEELCTGIDPSAGPPARVAIFRTGAEAHVVVLCQHHLFTDGLSLVRFWQEVLERYRAAALGVPPSLPPPGPSFARYCRAAADWLASAESAPSRAYWARTLEGAVPLVLPGDAPRTEPTDFRGDRLYFVIESGLRRGLESLAEREDTGVFSALLLALAETLHEATGQADLLLLTYHANRSLPGLANTFDVMGPLLSGLPLRVRLRPEQGRRARLRDAHRTVDEALEHGAVPLEFLRRALGVPVPAGQVCLMYQAFVPPSAVAVGGLVVRSPEPVGFGKGQASFELELVIWPDGDQLRGLAAFATQLFRRDAVERFTGRFLAALTALVDEAQALVDEA